MNQTIVIIDIAIVEILPTSFVELVVLQVALSDFLAFAIYLLVHFRIVSLKIDLVSVLIKKMYHWENETWDTYADKFYVFALLVFIYVLYVLYSVSRSHSLSLSHSHSACIPCLLWKYTQYYIYA